MARLMYLVALNGATRYTKRTLPNAALAAVQLAMRCQGEEIGVWMHRDKDGLSRKPGVHRCLWVIRGFPVFLRRRH